MVKPMTYTVCLLLLLALGCNPSNDYRNPYYSTYYGYFGFDGLPEPSEELLTKYRKYRRLEDGRFVMIDDDGNPVCRPLYTDEYKRITGLDSEPASTDSDQVQASPSEERIVPPATVSTGTAFAVTAFGDIVTAYHVLRGRSDVRVKFDYGDWIPAKLIDHSIANDVALLRVDLSTPNYLSFAKSKTIQQGQRVFTLGYPLTELMGNEPKYTEGNISSLKGIRDEASLMQISVPVQPGNSGGPLLNMFGDVVGMITSTAALQYFIESSGVLPQNVNWAVKSDYIIPLVPEDTDRRTKPMVDSARPADLVAFVRNSVCLVEAK